MYRVGCKDIKEQCKELTEGDLGKDMMMKEAEDHQHFSTRSWQKVEDAKIDG